MVAGYDLDEIVYSPLTNIFIRSKQSTIQLFLLHIPKYLDIW